MGTAYKPDRGEENMFRECAEKLIKRDGYAKARADTICLRNGYAPGSYMYRHHNTVLAMLEQLHNAEEA